MAENQKNAAKRIFVSVSNKSRYWPKAWESSEEMIEAALAHIKKDNPAILNTDRTILTKERWPSRIWLVFDIFNDTYDPVSAHLPGRNNLPVVMVSLGERDHAVAASKLIQDKVNESVREAHDLHGVGSRPPFIVDHANGNIPSYPNPRIQSRS